MDPGPRVDQLLHIFLLQTHWMFFIPLSLHQLFLKLSLLLLLLQELSHVLLEASVEFLHVEGSGDAENGLERESLWKGERFQSIKKDYSDNWNADVGTFLSNKSVVSS